MEKCFYMNIPEQNACVARLCNFGYAKSTAKQETRRHIHSNLELFYFEQGEGVVEVGKSVIQVRAHHLFIVDSSKLHLQYCKDKNASLLYYAFSVDNVALAGFNKNCVTRDGFFHYAFESEDNEIYRKILQLCQEKEKKEYNYIAKIALIFNEIFVDILRLVFSGFVSSIQNETNIVNTGALESAKAYIDEHFAEELTIDDLAKHAFMSKSYFITQFKHFFHVTPKQYLNLVRVQNACALLTASEDSVVKIALKVGFSNPVYFTELFTKIVKIAPSAYRKRYAMQGEKTE